MSESQLTGFLGTTKKCMWNYTSLMILIPKGYVARQWTKTVLIHTGDQHARLLKIPTY